MQGENAKTENQRPQPRQHPRNLRGTAIDAEREQGSHYNTWKKLPDRQQRHLLCQPRTGTPRPPVQLGPNHEETDRRNTEPKA